MKRCNKCKEDKELSEFYKNTKKKDGLQDYCKSCKKLRDQEYWSVNKDKWNKHYSETQKDNKVELNKLKTKCANCDESRHWVLDFHHLDPNTKEVSVGNVLMRNWSIERIEKEISKCIVLCSNCHRKLHYEEKHASVV